MRNFVMGCIVLFTMQGTAFSETKEPPKKLSVDLGGGVKMEMTLIPAGEFMMGSGESAEATKEFHNKTGGVTKFAAEGFNDEHPQHRVRITKPFYLGTYHVTRGQFRQFVADTHYKTDAEKGEEPGAIGWNPNTKKYEFSEKYSWRNAGFEQTDEHPVVNVSWNAAAAFCKWLGKKGGKTCRLPTEAEWEYACRAGSTTRYGFGDDASVQGAYAWYRANSDGKTHPAGTKKPNAWGLYDMHGNAWEWCADWYNAEYYAKSPTDDPTGPATGSLRVRRGSGWYSAAGACRSAYRDDYAPEFRDSDLGFRVALVPADKRQAR